MFKEGWTIGGLYKHAKKDGYSYEQIMELLNKTYKNNKRKMLYCSPERVEKFLREKEFGEHYCSTCQKMFINKDDEFGMLDHCPKCQKLVDEMWEKVYSTVKETGGDLEDTLLFSSILINSMVAMRVKDGS